MATINGNNGANTLTGTQTSDTINGLGGNDTLNGLGGNDTLDGGSGKDNLFGGADTDILIGGAGNDLLDGGTGGDTMRGDTGDDRYVVDDSGDVIVENANEGIDAVSSSISYVLTANVENLTLTDTGNINGTGNTLNNVIIGNSGTNILNGGAGNDTLTGNGGADTLTGDSGNDTFTYLAVSDSPAAGWDIITDFTQGADRIDLAAFLGATDLAWGNTTPTANGVWYAKVGTSTFVYADTNGNSVADLAIELTNTPNLSLVATDFIGVAGNTAPVITSGAAFNVAENSTAVTTVTATDAQGQALTYSLVAGGDAARFAINPSSGVLTFVAAPDFENPTDVGANNVYNLTVQVSDGSLATTQAIAVTVTDVNEGPGNTAPVITSGAAFSVAENSTAVTTVTATDAEAQALTYSLVAGGDAARFAINPASGVLTFVAAPDFENPTDVGANNVYNLTVQVSDGSLSTTQAIAVTVTNVINETLVGSGGADILAGGTGNDVITGNGGADTLTGNAGNDAFTYLAGSDSLPNANWQVPPDASVTRIWDIVTDFTQGTDKIDLAALLGATDLAWANTTPTGNAVWYTKAGSSTFVYADTDGNDPPELMIELQNTASLILTATDFIGVVGSGNTAPVITSGAAFNVAENSTAVTTVTATDAQGQALTYSLVAGGDAARFAINPNSGVLTFVAAPDFENPTDVGANNVYNLTVQVSDGSLATTQAIAVTVTDVNEGPGNTAPVITSGAAFSVAENSTAVTTVTATDAEAQALTYSLVAGGDAARFAINPASGVLTFVAAPDFENPTDVGANNVYNLTVQVSDGSLSTTQAIAVTVTNVINETLVGSGGADILAGGTGNDVITGNGGADTLTGNAGNDMFTYLAGSDSLPNANWQVPPDASVTRIWDIVTDFTQGTDKIDLAALLGATDLAWGNTTPNDNTVWYAKSGSSTFVYADTGNDAPPELMIELQNTASLILTATDFIGVVGSGNTAPVITSGAAFNVAENSTAVTTVTATDAQGQALTYSLVAGGDAARFAINPSSGVLTFVAAPDFENPTDVGANNVYNLTVQVSDGSLATTQAIAVTVTDVINEGFVGTPGDDTLTGTIGDDTFNISQGGNDTVSAGVGNDTVFAGTTFTSSDRIDGGTEIDDTVQIDSLVLDGNYSAGVVFGPATLTNVESIVLTAGNSYSLTPNDATLDNNTLTIDGSQLLAGNTLTVNASAETQSTSNYTMIGGAGNDQFTGGAGSDFFDLKLGGNDTVSAGGGGDTIDVGAAFTASDRINGGAGIDFLYLSGNYTGGVVFDAATLINVEVVIVQAGNSYNLTTNNGTLAAGQTLSIDGFGLVAGNNLIVNASAETDATASYTLTGGAGNDTFTGGAGNDILNGGTGNDTLRGGAGNDILNGGAGNDTLTGGLGNDVFDYNFITDGAATGEIITDFSKSGTNGTDVLNIHDLLTTFSGFNGANAFSGGYLQFDTSSGVNTVVKVDSNGGANSFTTLTTIAGTLLLQTDTSNYVV